MLYLLSFATVAWIISKIMKAKLGYWKSYQVSMHLAPIATTIFGILLTFKLYPSYIPMPYTLVMTALAILVLSHIKSSSKTN